MTEAIVIFGTTISGKVLLIGGIVAIVAVIAIVLAWYFATHRRA